MMHESKWLNETCIQFPTRFRSFATNSCHYHYSASRRSPAPQSFPPPTELRPRSTKIARGTCLPAPVSPSQSFIDLRHPRSSPPRRPLRISNQNHPPRGQPALQPLPRRRPTPASLLSSAGSLLRSWSLEMAVVLVLSLVLGTRGWAVEGLELIVGSSCFMVKVGNYRWLAIVDEEGGRWLRGYAEKACLQATVDWWWLASSFSSCLARLVFLCTV